MTIEEVKAALDHIAASTDDDEHAHGCQDKLFEAVLRHIAEGGDNAQALASEALKALDIEFSRWCA